MVRSAALLPPRLARFVAVATHARHGLVGPTALGPGRAAVHAPTPLGFASAPAGGTGDEALSGPARAAGGDGASGSAAAEPGQELRGTVDYSSEMQAYMELSLKYEELKEKNEKLALINVHLERVNEDLKVENRGLRKQVEEFLDLPQRVQEFEMKAHEKDVEELEAELKREQQRVTEFEQVVGPKLDDLSVRMQSLEADRDATRRQHKAILLREEEWQRTMADVDDLKQAVAVVGEMYAERWRDVRGKEITSTPEEWERIAKFLTRRSSKAQGDVADDSGDSSALERLGYAS